MNHKRRKPKNARAGCLMCKPHKANGAKGRLVDQTRQEREAALREREQRREASSPAPGGRPLEIP